MTLLGLRDNGWMLLWWRRARLLCCLVLCDLPLAALLFVPGAWSVGFAD